MQLNIEYAWRRKQFAMNVLAEWNSRTGTYRRGIEETLPGLLDASGQSPERRITRDLAKEIYLSDKAGKYWALRGHIVELLNYCEYIVVCYDKHVGDQDILKNSLFETLKRWYFELSHYMIVATEERKYNPWEALEVFMKRNFPDIDEGNEQRA